MQSRPRITVTRAAAVMGAMLALFLTGSLAAQSGNGLYGAAAPDDAAFVRVVHGGPSGALRDIWIGATHFRLVEPLTVSAYRPLTPGIHQVMVSGLNAELIPRRGNYYTVVVSGDRLHVLQDTAHTRPDRAQLVLYNFSDAEHLALRTADGATPVIEEVAAGGAGVIEVNAVAVELALFRASEVFAYVGDPGLERGQSYSVFAFSVAGETRVIVAQAEIALE
ncbi:MAG: hypothetical protein EA384_13800 [Spirochaetaceae bacterium]|nr:MAG: hypothetical protein EA384_13800 [Spirochaetaceae bacterium]